VSIFQTKGKVIIKSTAIMNITLP